MLDAASLMAWAKKRRWPRIPGWWPIYSIGIYRGPSPLDLRPDPNAENPVLVREDVREHFARLVADPFMIQVDGTWHMFFETLNWVQARRGEIAHASSRDGYHWEYDRVVLAEPYHLSYPYVLAWGGDHYMIPESSAAGEVRLYRADRFPNGWKLVRTLLRGPIHYDNSVFHDGGRWWMFTHTDDRRGTLRLFYSAELAGEWTEHPASPVVSSDLRISRPAGRLVRWNGRLLRFAQDCREAYGKSVVALEITRLTPEEYQETELAGKVIGGSGSGWNDKGMHHLDAHQLADGSWLACVDGWRHGLRRPREAALWAADHLQRWATR